MTVSVKDHTYEMSRKGFNKLILSLKKSLKKQPMIIAIEKDGHAIMLNDVYSTQKELTNAITSWNKKGYLVKYMRGI